MLLVADVHGAVSHLAAVAGCGEPLLVLGDLINFIDYRTNEGIVSDISGKEFVDEMVRLRTDGDFAAAGLLWAEFSKGREAELRRAYADAVEAAYAEIGPSLAGCEAYVTYGNVDRPDVLVRHLPPSATFVEYGVFDIEGMRVGIVGGGVVSIGTPGEITEDQMAARLEKVGDVDVLCTHVAPAVPALAKDVIGGRQKGSVALLEHLRAAQPRYHYFGDVHQPQATTWRIGATRCVNVGYFRATGRAVRHGA